MSKCGKAEPNRFLMLGFAALAVASVGQWYLQRHSGLSEDVADFGSGLLQGIAIATMLFGIWLRGRGLRK
jgi:hypothetical protein